MYPVSEAFLQAVQGKEQMRVFFRKRIKSFLIFRTYPALFILKHKMTAPYYGLLSFYIGGNTMGYNILHF